MSDQRASRLSPRRSCGSARSPRPPSGLVGDSRTAERGTVDVDDAALFIGRMRGGALASFEATRFAAGRKNALRIEINGSKGSLAFDFEAMNELWFHDHTLGGAEAGFRRILVTEARAPVRGGLVAAGARARLRTHLHPRGEGFP